MADVGLGLQTVMLQEQSVNGQTVVDLDIPAGKVVISSGIKVIDFGFGNALLWGSSPHPTDAAKWQFQVSTKLQSGGSNTVVISAWVIVANAASLWPETLCSCQ